MLRTGRREETTKTSARFLPVFRSHRGGSFQSGYRLAPGGVRVTPVYRDYRGSAGFPVSARADDARGTSFFRGHRGDAVGPMTRSRRVASAGHRSSGATEAAPSVRRLARAVWRSLAVVSARSPRRSSTVHPMRRLTAPFTLRGPKTRRGGRSGSGFPHTHVASCDLRPGRRSVRSSDRGSGAGKPAPGVIEVRRPS